MQNWNQWHLSTDTITTSMPQPPVGYVAPGADPMATMQAYMQYYNQPAPSGYTAEQWATAQQQNWTQWHQWQQQFQQWQAQYGEKYQETMKQLSTQSITSLASQAPPLPTVQPPPLPKEDTTKPPLPPDSGNQYQFMNMPPPHQNNLPLFPTKQSTNSAVPPKKVLNFTQDPPLPPNQPPLPIKNIQDSINDSVSGGKRGSNFLIESSSAKKLKVEDEELTEAEKTFDAQFKQWEEQFNKWKQQNANHPDKAQYKQYEAKWTSWREKLIERREQMRRKREQQKQTAAKADAEKNKSLPGGDKLLNILSNTENQGLINNLLGIGKTLGLTGKQDASVRLPLEPTSTDVRSSFTTSLQGSSTISTQSMISGMAAPAMTPDMNHAAWAAQQWAAQYNTGLAMSNFASFQPMTGMSSSLNTQSNQVSSVNFTQPPPNLSNLHPPNLLNLPPPNFSQPPPGFKCNDSTQIQGSGSKQDQGNVQDRPVPRLFGSDGDKRNSSGSNKDCFGSTEDRFGTDGNRFDPSDNRSNYFGSGNNHFGRGGLNNFGSSDRGGLRSQFSPINEHFGRDGQVRDCNPNDKSGNQFRLDDRFRSKSDRFDRDNERFGANDKEDLGGDRLGKESGKFGDHGFLLDKNTFSPHSDRFGSNSDRFGANNDTYDRNNIDRFESSYTSDNKRDIFGSNGRRFKRNNQFEPPDEIAPELKKLMEKRKAAMDIFKPRDNFLNFDKISSIGSLSESFKKIAGDSPFMSRNSSDLRGSDSIETRGDIRPRGANDFKSGSEFRIHGSGGLGPRSSVYFGPRRSVEFGYRGNNLDIRGPRGPDVSGSRNDFGNPRGEIQFNVRGLTDFESRTNEFIPREREGPNQRQLKDFKSMGANSSNTERSEDNQYLAIDNVSIKQLQESSESGKLRENVEQSQNSANNFRQENNASIESGTEVLKNDGSKTDAQQNLSTISQGIPPLERPVWMDVQFPEDNSNEKKIDTETIHLSKNVPTDFANSTGELNVNTSKHKEGDTIKCANLKGNAHSTDDITSEHTKKTDVLPFLGENDPKPEDLNMEPPPELPNLGSVLENLNQSSFKNNAECKKSDDKPFISKNPNIEQLGLGGINPVIFAPRNSFDGSLALKSMQLKPKELMSFNSRDLNDRRFPPFGLRRLNNDLLGNIELNPFASRGFDDGQCGVHGSNDGQSDLRDPNNIQFGPQGSTDEQFGSQSINNGQCGLRCLNDEQFGLRGPSDEQFGYRPPFGLKCPNDERSRSSLDGNFNIRCSINGPNPGIPSLMGLKLDRHRSSGLNEVLNQGNNEFHVNGPHNQIQSSIKQGSSDHKTLLRSQGMEQRLPFRQAGQSLEQGPSFGQGTSSTIEQKGLFEQSGPSSSNWRSSFPQNIGVLNQRNRFEPSDIEKPASFGKFGPGYLDRRSSFGQSETGSLNQRSLFGQGRLESTEQRTSFSQDRLGRLSSSLEERSLLESSGRDNIARCGDLKTGCFSESSSGSDCKQFSSRPFIRRPIDIYQERSDQQRSMPVKEFCIEKQFNYNHGGSTPDKFIVEHIPAKIIDYAHTPSQLIQNYLTPAQCFDYGHGNLKPIVLDHEICLQRDFRHWKENEQNLKDYTEGMKQYVHDIRWQGTSRAMNRKQEQLISRDCNWPKNERRFLERERISFDIDEKNKRDNRGKKYYINRESGQDDKTWECTRDRDHDDWLLSDKNNSREKIHGRCDKIQKDMDKESDKDDERSKGNNSWQECSTKNIVDTSHSVSVPEVNNDAPDMPPKILELPKPSNYTMVDDLLCPPGRQNRPPKIVIILRGPPGSGKSFVAKLVKDKEVEQGGSAPRILSLDDYFLAEKEVETNDDNGKKIIIKEMTYEYEEAMEQSYMASLVKAFKKNITDGFFNFIILDCINEKISDYEDMWSFAKTKGFRVYVCEMEMDVQICLKRNIHNRTEEEINRIIDYFEPTPSYHQKLDVNSMLQEQAIEEVYMEDNQETLQVEPVQANEDSQDSQDDIMGVSKWERMEAEDKLDRLDGLAKRKNEGKPQTMEDFLQVPDYYNMEDTSGKKRVRWADLEERKEQEKLRAVGFVVGHTNWDRMMDPTKGGSALTRTKFFSLS